MSTAQETPHERLRALVADMRDDDLDEFYRRCNPDSQHVLDRILTELHRTGWRYSPIAMAHHLTKGQMQRWPYAELLSDKFVDAVEGRSIRQIWNLPARYGKSKIASQWGPTWALDKDPTTKLILTSYGNLLAKENAIAVRDNLVTYGDQLDVKLRPDRRRADRFVTAEGGGIIAGGIESALTGFGGHGAVVDDPFKNWQEAHSEVTRDTVWNWYRSVLRLRLETEIAWIIVVMTRWHENDLCGRLIDAEADGEQWELIRLPAIADSDDDLLGRKIGDALEPRRFTLESVLQRASALGSYLTAGMEQQLPAPEEGSDIKRAWWQWYSEPPPKYDDALTSWDMKLKDKETGDFVVGIAMGRTGTDFWGIDLLRGQWNFVQSKTAIALLQVRHPWIKRHVIENSGNGPEVMADLRRKQPGYTVSEDVRSSLGIADFELPQVERLFRRGMGGLVPENAKGDKRIRMRAQTPLIEAGNVHLPENAMWATGLVDEMALFPNGTHDDQVDAVSQALKRLAQGSARVTRPTKSPRTPPANAPSTRKRSAAAVFRPGMTKR